ncbi:response regulator transcription factor [Prosthecobacter sp.]|uniref:response regulator transcription factor n=1 Tax=Prosthecobacter sp. TaxID=1965333 RepID=UPI002ABD11D9|nr:response regulator transcription factor [Prosthecobacter sp.]MDZ4402141.1 response regulator transcription factor [Prosthecobacter sp.]
MSASPPIRVLIVDDHFATRLGLAVPINSEAGMTVVAEASTGARAIELYREHRPDVLLMDYRLPDQTGVTTLEALRVEFPHIRALILSVFDGEEDIYRAVQAGARGYLTKAAECEEVLRAIRCIAAGETYFPAEIAAKLHAREQRKPLTPRELEILKLLVKGHSTKEIVDLLHMSMGTIRLHISLILEKLEAFDRTRAVAIAIERGIVHVGE